MSKFYLLFDSEDKLIATFERKPLLTQIRKVIADYNYVGESIVEIYPYESYTRRFVNYHAIFDNLDYLDETFKLKECTLIRAKKNKVKINIDSSLFY